MTNRQNPLLLRIFEGSGIRTQINYNPFLLAKTLCSDSNWQNYPHAEPYNFAIRLGLPGVHMATPEIVHPPK